MSKTLYSVSNSSGIDIPTIEVPPNSCDAHLHIYSKDFQYSGEFIEKADVSEYQKLQQRLGTSRAIIVNSRIYGTNNDCVLNAIQTLGMDHARGIAVVNPTVSDKELERLHTAGIRGVRFTLYTLDNAPTTFDMVELVAKRIKDLGWHVQLHWMPDQITQNIKLLEKLHCPIVFDHLGRITPSQYSSHSAYQYILSMLKEGRAWMKLSGAYLNSSLSADNYSELQQIASSYVESAPDRVVWGSDWPHPTEKLPKLKPNDSQLLNLLSVWAPNDELRKKILVDNPKNLYTFD